MTSIPIILFLLLTLVNFSSSNLQREFQASIDRAMMTCSKFKPPLEPVLAMSPSRYPQLVALLNVQAGVPPCGPQPSRSPFYLEDETTWPFCTLGRCEGQRCSCVPTYTGTRCTIYKRKCWLMYCFLSSCKPTHQSFSCICDSNLYGRKVLTGDYWYDDGRRRTFEPPPPGWKDNSFDRSDPMSSTNTKSRNRLISPPEESSLNNKADESRYSSSKNKMNWDKQKYETENTNRRPSKLETNRKEGAKFKSEGDKFKSEGANFKSEGANFKSEAVKPNSVSDLGDNKEQEADQGTEDIKEALEEEIEESSSIATSALKALVIYLTSVFVIFFSSNLVE